MKKQQVINNINPLVLKGIAHRGLWNEELTENGIPAFQNAIDHNVAFELDIHLTKDNQLLVCHDSELYRTTGKKGIIEDLTLAEIKENYRLHDGSSLPTLEEVLALTSERVPIIIELKAYQRNHKRLALRFLECLPLIKDKKNFMLISFDPRALLPLKKSGIMRSLLVVRDGKHDIIYAFRHFFESVDLDQRFFTKKNVQRYSKKHFVNCWTIETEEQAKALAPYVDTITFQKVSHVTIASVLEHR